MLIMCGSSAGSVLVLGHGGREGGRREGGREEGGRGEGGREGGREGS